VANAIDCRHLNHINIVVRDHDATVEHFLDLFDMQHMLDMPQADFHASLLVLGNVMFEVFAPNQWLLNSRHGPHYLGLEFQADVAEARSVLEERGIGIVRDIDIAIHTDPVDSHGVAFEFYAGNFHTDSFEDQWRPIDFWRDSHALGCTGLKRYSVVVSDLAIATAWYCDVLGAAVVYEEARPTVSARAVGLRLAGATAELLTPTAAGPIRDELYSHGEGIRSTVFEVRDLTAVEDHFNNRGVPLARGDAEDTLAIVPEINRGIMFEFSE
jgi:catechol 2,3-dioxygenase-like lactoylglutathione lyase family enzyme